MSGANLPPTCLLSEANNCGRALLRLLSRAHAVAAELQRTAAAIPPGLHGDGPEAKRLAAVLPGFEVYREEGAIERVAQTPELIELDEDSRELHFEWCKRLFNVLKAIRKYHIDVSHFIEDVECNVHVGYSIESLCRDPDGSQLMAEAVALLGSLLLIADDRIPGVTRERALVLFHRCTMGTAEEENEYPEVCKLFRKTSRPPDGADRAARPKGYPENYFARFALERDAIRMIIGQLQTGDVYTAAKHYPLPEHRSHGLSAQAGLLYVALYFDPKTLETDFVAMREIVDRHFGDTWVVAYALGCTADLLAEWAPYPAAKQALGAAIKAPTVKILQEQHLQRLHDTRKQLADYLIEGVLSEEFVSQKTSAILNCLRQANTTIRWLLLQPTTTNPEMTAVCKTSTEMRDELLQTLVDTALLEEKVKSLLGGLVQRRDADWDKLRTSASQAMDDLAVFFSGEHALRRNVKNQELERWFRGLQQRIDELGIATQDEQLTLGRKIQQINRALEEVGNYHEVSSQLQIVHFLSDARETMQKMLRTANLSQDTLRTIETVADLSYAWRALGAYKESMRKLLSSSPDSVKGLRALFLKLGSILEAPLRRIRQAGNETHGTSVSAFYSSSLVEFMRTVLQEIPRLIFGILGKIAQQKAARPPEHLASRINLSELSTYAQRSEEARQEVEKLTKQIALLMRGIRETRVAVLGVITVDPREVLVDGLRQELARKIEALFSELVFNTTGGVATRKDFVTPLEVLAQKSETLRKSFEYVQDYVGVSALHLWHTEFTRIISYLLFMEQHSLLRRRIPLPTAFPFHDPAVPLAFPDKGTQGPAVGNSFISRAAAMLVALADCKASVGGLQGEWRTAAGGDVLLDELAIETMRKAIGVQGIAAIDKLLGLRVAGRIRSAFTVTSQLLSNKDCKALLSQAKVECLAGGSAAHKALRAVHSKLGPQVQQLSDVLATLGSMQLVRRRLCSVRRLALILEAPLAGGALATLDAAVLAEALELDGDQEQGVSDLPSLWDFVGGEGASPEERMNLLRRRVSRCSELSGLVAPMRQLYTSVPEGPGNLQKGIEAMLALVILAAPTGEKAVFAAKKAASKRSTTPSKSTPEQSRGEVLVALSAGLATALQQLPRVTTDAMLQLSGAYISGLCSEAAESGSSQAWVDGATIIELLNDALTLLGLPREHLAEFVPQSLLDLWPLD